MPTIHTVTTLADSGAGSLRGAIAQSQSGDTITFATSLAGQTITLTSGELDIPVGKNLTIDGAAAPGITISGNTASRIFLLNSTSATPTQLTVKNLSLVDGYTLDRGGAISTTHQGKLVIDGVTFKNNVADNGGGAIFSAFEGTVTVTNSTFTGNKAVAGNDERGAGAIAFWGPNALTVKNSTFTHNKGINGAAINSLNGKLTIENSTFINNDTTAATYDTGNSNPSLRGYGGAIYTDRASTSSNSTSGTIRIVNSLFQGNTGRAEGGAAYLYTGTQDNVVIESSSFLGNTVQNLPQGNDGNGGAVVILSNGLNKGLTINRSTFANNTASNQGGGLWMMDAPTTITNSTFSGNRVNGTASNKVGGGMTLYGPTDIINSTIANNHAGWVGGGVSANDSKVTVKNTIFSNNTSDNGTNDWGIQQHTNRELTDKGGNIQWPPKQTNNFNDYNATASVQRIDPKLGPLQDNGGGSLTHALLDGSPAINSGVGNGIPTLDQRGALRDGMPDIGAVEFGAEVPQTGDGTLPVDTGTSPNSSQREGDRLTGTNARDRLVGTRGHDRLFGMGGKDTLKGKGGRDVLKGGNGKDRLFGGNGKDKLIGQAGNDILVGGRGNDILKGGKGKDRYVFTNPKDGVDKIRGFDLKGDRLDLSDIFDRRKFKSRRPLRDYVELTQRGPRTVVSIDPNGDRNPDTFKKLVVLTGIDSNDLADRHFID